MILILRYQLVGTCLIFPIQGNHDGKVGQPGSVHATRISFVSIFFQQFYAKINFRVISLAEERMSKCLHAWVSFPMKNSMILIPILKSRKSTEYRMHITIG